MQAQTFAALAVRCDHAVCTGADRMSAVVEAELGTATVVDSTWVGTTLAPRSEHNQILE